MRITNLLRQQVEKPSLRRKTSGAPPGTLVYTGRQEVDKVEVHATYFGPDSYRSEDAKGEIPPISQEGRVNWLDVRGLHQVDLVAEIGKKYDVHPLALEDILDVQQRPKLETYPGGVLIIIKAFAFDSQTHELSIEQVSLYLTKDTVLTFQEDADDLFGPIRRRLESASGRIRSRGADYLAYALVDSTVDRYFNVLDQIEAVQDELEAAILDKPENHVKAKIHNLRLALLTLRKSVSPLRELMRQFGDFGGELISDDTQFFVRDLRDHVIQITDLVETYRDINNGLYDLYVSEISFRTNRIMQTLTVVSTIFIPLSFLVGVYGMNREHMPELGARYGYFVLWGVMLSIITGMLFWFRRQGWV